MYLPNINNTDPTVPGILHNGRHPQDTENYSHFIEQRENLEDSFAYKYLGWKNIDLNDFHPLKLKLYASDIGKKIFKQILVQLQVACLYLVKKQFKC